MATRDVALSTSTWTQISAATDTSISAWLGSYALGQLNGPVAVSIQTAAANCTVRNSVPLTNALPAATAIPIGTGEAAWALYIGSDTRDPYIVVQGA